MGMIIMLKNYGLLAEYETPHAICEASKKIRDAGYKNWDACTPFPVHGLDKAMGLKDSVLPWMVLVAGTTGCVLISWLMIWVAAYDYPLNIGGKPTWSIPAFVPPAFEVTILFSALTAVFGMFFLNGLPRLNHPLFHSKRFERVTDDKFFIVIEAQDKLFDLEKTKALLEGTHPVAVELVEEQV
jgi:hypothetical protein